MPNNNKDQLNMADLAANLPSATAALSAEDRAGIVNALKNKLKHLEEEKTDILESLTPNVRRRVEALQELQSQHSELEAKFSEEKAALEAKYQKLYEPMYSERYDIVNGVVEVDGVTKETTMDEGEEKSQEEKGVPNFWLTAMKNHEVLADEITERDEGALKYLKDIKWARIDNPKGFKLEFFFDTNPYFKNTVLTKTYHMIDEDDPILEKAIGTPIEWHPGKCLTQKTLKKKPKKGSDIAKPLLTKTEDCESFFNFFKPPQVPDEEDDLDDDSVEDLQSLLEQDYEVGSAIRDKIIPRAVCWFTGEAVEADDSEDTDDDDDDVEEVEPKITSRPRRRVETEEEIANAANAQPLECKQQ